MKCKEFLEHLKNTEKLDKLMFLYDRWLDEGEYEDINDYLEVIKKIVPEAYKIQEKPFCIICKCSDGDITLNFEADKNSISITANW